MRLQVGTVNKRLRTALEPHQSINLCLISFTKYDLTLSHIKQISIRRILMYVCSCFQFDGVMKVLQIRTFPFKRFCHRYIFTVRQHDGHISINKLPASCCQSKYLQFIRRFSFSNIQRQYDNTICLVD